MNRRQLINLLMAEGNMDDQVEIADVVDYDDNGEDDCVTYTAETVVNDEVNSRVIITATIGGVE